MTGDRSRQVEELFHRAAALPEAERSPWLSEACAGDTDLRREVAALLSSAGDQATQFVGPQVEGAVREFHAANPVTDGPVRRLGPYRLIREIGAGGMGTVFLAERADDQYEGQVAIKLMRPGLDTDFFLERFRRERQTLARLQHPNIARLLDSGASETGVPFIVMELIDGGPINQYCVEHKLTIHQRLRLFLPVCAAVAYAHQNFVVHRDLKPGNIFVDRTGAPKLLDFGICKLVFSEDAAGVTMTQGAQMMTPDYASPEQVRGESITAASDIYSLGAVLYGLLTGASAHPIGKYTPHEIERVVCHQDVQRPSSVVADRAAAKHLSGDLDNILLKALQKDPARRYASVEQFAEDVRRYLDHLPVSARPDTVTYRARKFARRNRGPLVAGVAVFLALAGGASVAIYQAIQAGRHFTQARQIASALIFEVHDEVRDLPGSLKARQAIVRTGLGYLDSLAGAARSDAGVRRELAAAYERMGELQGNVLGSHTGDTPGALVSYDKAVKLLEALPESREVLLDRALVYRKIGELQTYTNTVAKAQEALNRGLAVARILHDRYPNDRAATQALADIHVGLSRAQRLVEDRAGALVSITEAVRLLRELAAAKPDDAAVRGSLAASLSAVGMAQAGLNQREEARGNHAAAITEWNALIALQPTNSRHQRQLMLAYSHLGDVLGNPNYVNLGDTAGALAAFRSMLAIGQKLYAANPADQGATIDYGMSLMRAGAMPGQTPKEQLEMFRKSEELLDSVARANPANANNKVNLASLREQIGDVLLKAGDRDRAREAFNACLTTAQPLFDSVHTVSYRLAITCSRKLAEEAARRKAWTEALAHAKEAVAVGDRAFRSAGATVPTRTNRARGFAAMGSTMALLGDAAAAREWNEKSLALWRDLQYQPGFTQGHRNEMNAVQLATRSK